MPMFKHGSSARPISGVIYITPDFETATLKVDKYTHSAVPSAGLVLGFGSIKAAGSVAFHVLPLA